MKQTFENRDGVVSSLIKFKICIELVLNKNFKNESIQFFVRMLLLSGLAV